MNSQLLSKVLGVLAGGACVACCAAPFLGTVGLGSVAALLSRRLEVGLAVFAAAAMVTALGVWRRKPATPNACGSSCQADGRCCDHGTRQAP
jgi:hypothetical protein